MGPKRQRNTLSRSRRCWPKRRGRKLRAQTTKKALCSKHSNTSTRKRSNTSISRSSCARSRALEFLAPEKELTMLFEKWCQRPFLNGVPKKLCYRPFIHELFQTY